MLDHDGIPGWYNQTDLAELRRLATQASTIEGCAIEFGSFQGRSSVAIHDAIGHRLLCVDPWPDDSTYQAFYRHVAGRDIVGHRCGWEEFLDRVDPYGLRFAFVHIDACHEYQDVYENIARILPLMTPGGVLCGHDYGWPNGSHDGVTRAVDELLPHRYVAGSVWSVDG